MSLVEWIGTPVSLRRPVGLSGVREWLQPIDALGQVPAACQQQYDDWKYAANVSDAACIAYSDFGLELERLQALPAEDPQRQQLDQITQLWTDAGNKCNAAQAQSLALMAAYEACAGKGTVIRPKPATTAPATTAPAAAAPTAAAPSKSNTGLIVLAIATAGALALALS